MRGALTIGRARALSALLTGVMLIGCGGGGDGTTQPPAPKPVATVAVSLAASSIIVGRTAQATAALADATGATLTGRAVQWTTSSAATATVDQSGLVTGVAPGTVTVTATSEGKSGSASLTVTTDPATTATVDFGAITANGQAVDLTKVAGPISVTIDRTAPPGFVGSFTLSLRGIEVRRVTLPLTAPDNGASHEGSGTNALTITETVQIETPIRIITISQSDLLDVGVRWQNGVADLVASLNGTVGTTPVQATTTRSLTLANPSNSMIAVMLPNGARATGSGSTTWDAGDFKVYVSPLNYESTPALLESVEVMFGPAPVAYGFTNATVNVFTKTVAFTPTATPAPFTITKAELNGESPVGGSRIWLGHYRINGVVFDPQSAVPAVNGLTFDTNADGLVDDVAAPQGATLPVGVTRGLTLPNPTLTFPTGKWLYGTSPFRYDNKAPVVPDNAFTLTGRITTLYQTPFDLDGKVGYINSLVAPDVNPRRFINFDAIVDGGIGRRDDDTEYYFGTSSSLASLTTMPNRWSVNVPLMPNPNRTLYGAAVFPDLLGNRTSTFLRATAGNPYTTGNAIGTPLISPALFGVGSTTAGTGTLTGIVDRAHSTSTSLGATLNYRLSTIGGNGVFGDYGLTASVFKNDSCVIGAGPTCQRVNIPAVASGAGSVEWRLSDMLSNVPGADKQGLYKVSFTGYDNIGLSVGGSYNGFDYRILHDYTAPVVQTGIGVTSAFTAGQMLPFRVTATDNVSVNQLYVRTNFEGFPSGAFRFGYVNAPSASTAWSSPFSNALAPAFDQTLSAALPHAIQLYGLNGLPSSPVYRLSSIDLLVRDGNGTFSSNALRYPISPAFLPSSFTALPADLNFTLDPVPMQTVCSERMLACSASALRTTELTVRARTAMSTNPFIFAQFFAITQAGDVFRVCRTSLATSLFAAVWTYAYSCLVDWDEYKGPPGALTLFAWLYGSQYTVAKSQFYTVNLQVQ